MSYPTYNIDLVVSDQPVEADDRNAHLEQEIGELKMQLSLWQKMTSCLERIKYQLEVNCDQLKQQLIESKLPLPCHLNERELNIWQDELNNIKSLCEGRCHFDYNQDVVIVSSNVMQIDPHEVSSVTVENADNLIVGNDNHQLSMMIDSENHNQLMVIDNQTLRKPKKENDTILPDEAKKYNCSWPGCGYATNLSGNFQKHFRIHTGEKPYKCDYEGCDYRCSDPKSIKDHKRCIHTKEKNHPCTFPGCDRSFGRSYEVKVHYMKHHKDPEEWPHKCQWPGCDRSFLFPKELDKHVLHHTGERPFKCDVEDCGATFNHSSILSRHKKELHAPKVASTCGYDGCQSKFLRQRDLDQHVKRVHLGVLGPKKAIQKRRSAAKHDHDYLDAEQRLLKLTKTRPLSRRRIGKLTTSKSKTKKTVRRKTKSVAKPSDIQIKAEDVIEEG